MTGIAILGPGAETALERYLRTRVESSMFLLSNLLRDTGPGPDAGGAS